MLPWCFHFSVNWIFNLWCFGESIAFWEGICPCGLNGWKPCYSQCKTPTDLLETMGRHRKPPWSLVAYWVVKDIWQMVQEFLQQTAPNKAYDRPCFQCSVSSGKHWLVADQCQAWLHNGFFISYFVKRSNYWYTFEEVSSPNREAFNENGLFR